MSWGWCSSLELDYVARVQGSMEFYESNLPEAVMDCDGWYFNSELKNPASSRQVWLFISRAS